ncbi:MAG: hypothetical protein ACPGUV_12820, partial [Polyangiales bacterium]
LVQVSFALARVGDVVETPVDLGGRWSVIKLTGRRPPEHRSLKQSARGIRLKLWRERRKKAVDALVGQLKKRHQPNIFHQRLAWIHIEPPPIGGGLPGFPQDGKAGSAAKTRGK